MDSLGVNRISTAVLRAAYWKRIEELIAEYPSQEQNRPHYRWLRDTARLGVVARDLNGTLTHLRAGDEVLVWGGGSDMHLRAHLRQVWHPRNTGTTCTIARQGDLKEGW